ncbi:hypothetical protein OG389_35395 [Streptomyces sp. NBC_00435]|uniref:hypothetical protein n=1 Tax=Streptomyces sp. NBC_00435 TaxID=2903649 RepID=UPI002E1BF725
MPLDGPGRQTYNRPDRGGTSHRRYRPVGAAYASDTYGRRRDTITTVGGSRI